MRDALGWDRVKRVFFEAQALEPAGRDALLRDLHRNDPALAREVASLLDASTQDDAFLEPPARAAVQETLAVDEPLRPGDRVGAYELVELIAAGGMGAVFRARRADEAFQKQVAVKVLHGALDTPRLRRRFRMERQTLATLEHPNITRLLDGGTTGDGVPYLVMEHVDGAPIDRWCDERRLPIRDRLELFRTVCHAVQAAHRSLVVHGDLKPANILVTDEGAVKLVDFGISRLLDDRHVTSDPAVGGSAVPALTPRYASPEQTRGEPLTTAADVYSLGVVLYELLCGRPLRRRGGTDGEAAIIAPSDALREGGRHDATTIEANSAARGETPERLRRRLAGDLDLITLAAVHDEPSRRYASVEHLADDVDRSLEIRPVRARRESFGDRAAKFVRRNPTQVAAAAVTILAILAAFAGVTAGSIRATRAARLAESQRNAAIAAKEEAQEVLGFFQQMLATSNPYRIGRRTTVVELIDEAERRLEHGQAGRPEVEAGVRLAIARSYASLMMWDAVAEQMQRALPLYRHARGARSLEVAECLGLLGRALSHLKHPDAIAMQREGLAIRRSLQGDEDALVAESTGNLAFALWSSQTTPRWVEAEAAYLEALDRYDRLGLEASRDAARFTMSLGVMYQRMGRAADAETRYRQALELYDELPVNEDLYELATLRAFADLLWKQDRLEETRVVLDRALAIIPEDFNRRRRADVLWSIAHVDLARGELDAAAATMREAATLEAEIAIALRPDSVATLQPWIDALRGDQPTVEVLPRALAAIGAIVPDQLQSEPERLIAARTVAEELERVRTSSGSR